MNILPLINETFDSFLLKSQQIHKESIQKALERYDKELYSVIDKNRYILIHLNVIMILSMCYPNFLSYHIYL